MFDPLILADFMYFPKDKTEYIPAVISLFIFIILAILAMRYFIVISKREAKKAKQLEEQIMNQQEAKQEQ
jgi:preprotein translocase subunit YajC